MVLFMSLDKLIQTLTCSHTCVCFVLRDDGGQVKFLRVEQFVEQNCLLQMVLFSYSGIDFYLSGFIRGLFVLL